jgi:hypothetical protein
VTARLAKAEPAWQPLDDDDRRLRFEMEKRSVSKREQADPVFRHNFKNFLRRIGVWRR